MSKYTHIDCFSGVGGICTGFHSVGFETKVAIEKVESCVDTYRKNHPDVHVFHRDIANVADDEIRNIAGDSIDVVTSGMPCETFSTAGAKSRSFYDERQFLFKHGIRVAKAVNAKIILFENVVGILSKKTSKNGSRLIIDELYESLADAGYGNFLKVVLNAADFGVPQYRERFFVIASKFNDWELKVPSGTPERVTVGEALCDLPKVKVNSGIDGTEYLNKSSNYIELIKNNNFWKRQGDGRLTYHRPPNHRPATIERFELTQPGEGLKDLFLKFSPEEIIELQERRVLPKKVYIQRGRRLLKSDVSPTVTSHCLDELVHPIYNRALTVRECARLQSFPDSYDFVGGPYIVPHIYHTQDKYEQIGDAVPPLLARAWANCISEILKDNSHE